MGMFLDSFETAETCAPASVWYASMKRLQQSVYVHILHLIVLLLDPVVYYL